MSHLKDLKESPLARELIDKLLFEAFRPMAHKDASILAIQVGRRNLAVELLSEMEVIKYE